MAHGSKSILFCRECSGLGARRGVACPHCDGTGAHTPVTNDEELAAADLRAADARRAALRRARDAERKRARLKRQEPERQRAATIKRQLREAQHRVQEAEHQPGRVRSVSPGVRSSVPEYHQEYRRQNAARIRESDRARSAARYAIRSAWLYALKRRVGCQVCGESFPPALDFHHVDQDQKRFGIAEGVVYAMETVLSELQKCVLLCANCHRKEQHGMIDAHSLTRINWHTEGADVPLTVERPPRLVVGAGRPRKDSSK